MTHNNNEAQNNLKNIPAPQKSNLQQASSTASGLIHKSKSVVFDQDAMDKDAASQNWESPIKLMRQSKSINGLKMTPNQLKRSNSKIQIENLDDLENDASFAASSVSGKNSRRKSSVMRMQTLRDQDDEMLSNSGDHMLQGNLFESHSKKASSALRCLHDNENDGKSGNAPRKATIRQTNARYIWENKTAKNKLS